MSRIQLLIEAGLRGLKLCKIGGCNGPLQAKGFCNTHYLRIKRLGRPDLPKRPTFCSERACGVLVTAKGLCKNHYTKRKYYEDKAKEDP